MVPVDLKPAEGWLLLPEDCLFILASLDPVYTHKNLSGVCVCVLETIKIRASCFGGGGGRRCLTHRRSRTGQVLRAPLF